MYANLAVIVDGDVNDPLYAWKVEVKPEGTIVYLDAQDGRGKYAEPAGTRQFKPGADLYIRADF